MVIAREQFNPEISKDYWLGYVGRYSTRGSSFGGQSVNGVYFGVWGGRHLFLNVNSEGEIERYTCPKNECFLVWWGGEDEPSIPAPSVEFTGISDRKLEKEATIEMVVSSIKQIREANERARRKQLEALFVKR